uniref:peptidylprolyl isomerase n=1 Tax=Chlamydomonas euryale TaxID=1486919 RepID=A0A7R9V9D2_9CHLO
MGGAAALAAAAALSALPSAPPAFADDEKVLCDAACAEGLDKLETVTTESGLKYKDIVVGKGAIPPTGYQVVVHYVAMTPAGRVFFNSLSSRPLDIRVGSGQVVAGLDEGLQTMKPGGIRRLYIPGDMAFPKGLKAAAGRPTVPPNSPVMFDVQLLYIPGLEDDEE